MLELFSLNLCHRFFRSSSSFCVDLFCTVENRFVDRASEQNRTDADADDDDNDNDNDNDNDDDDDDGGLCYSCKAADGLCLFSSIQNAAMYTAYAYMHLYIRIYGYNIHLCFYTLILLCIFLSLLLCLCFFSIPFRIDYAVFMQKFSGFFFHSKPLFSNSFHFFFCLRICAYICCVCF